MSFDVYPDDLEQMYAEAEQIAQQLGLSENLNNSNGITEYDEIFYGAGREEGRIFIIASATSGGGFRAAYQTRHSDRDSIEEAYERVVEKNRQEREGYFGPDNPRQLEDIEGYEDDDEEGEESSED